MAHSRDRNDETSSHTHLTDPVRLGQLHTTAFDNDDGSAPSSVEQSTHIDDKQEDVEGSAAAMNIGSKKEGAQNTAVMPGAQEKDANLVGWEGMVASSPDVRSIRLSILDRP